jgi:uncharacterized protein YebE (UPF0316 family)
MQTVTEWLDAYPVFWPLFIILARITDVSLGTVRTICVVRGARWTAACLGFAEVIVWITAVSGVLIQPTLVKVVSYGLGFALGNACGVWMEGRLAMGQQRIVAISKNYSQAIAMALRMADYTVTEVPARGGHGAVAMCFVIAPRKKANQIVSIITGADEDAVVVVEDVRRTVMSRRPATAVATTWRAVLKKK